MSRVCQITGRKTASGHKVARRGLAKAKGGVGKKTTGITKRQVIDWRSTPRGADLKPAIVIKDSKGKVAKLGRGGEARFLLSVDAILSVEPGSKVSEGDVLARVPMESAKTKEEAAEQLSIGYRHLFWWTPSPHYFLELYQGKDWALQVYDPKKQKYDYYDRK